MPAENQSYTVIQDKIHSLKDIYPSLREKSDAYVFSALCIRANLYKNPALVLNESDLMEMIVDGPNDGGVDVLLTDPNSENSDLVIAQSKYYTTINKDDVASAMNKMAAFYKDMKAGRYEQANAKVQRRFLSLDSEQAEDARVKFIFYTSALQAGINRVQLERQFRSQFEDDRAFDVKFYFGKDIEEEIKESESRRPTVEQGKIKIDQARNWLCYGDKAVIVNASAFSIKTLYAQHNIQLLSKNLRYHIAGREIDQGINETIRTAPESFWMKNNGITIICDDFEADGREVRLRNFSIINGGQTTYMLHKNPNINQEEDLYLPCKIIRNDGETEDERNNFSLAIAKAANTQKPIKAVDLKANAPEQMRFSRAMREEGIFYQTKRGEEVPRAYKEDYLNTALLEVGKLALAAIFQMPCASRNKPSTLYRPEYYEKIFNGNQMQMARISKELLYIDFYYHKSFLKKFDRENRDSAISNDSIAFAHNSRTVCIAFVALASRYYQGNITEQKMEEIFNASRHDSGMESKVYEAVSDIEGLMYLFPEEVFQQKDRYEEILEQLFNLIIEAGTSGFVMARDADNTLTPTNFLKKDRNYYKILYLQWRGISREIKKILQDAIPRSIEQ